jgi:hypothetical protein
MNTLMSILIIVQTSMSSGKVPAGNYNETEYGLAVVVFFVLFILLIIVVTPVKQDKGEQ